MDWIFLVVGIVLFGIGIVGQIRGRQKANRLPAQDRLAGRWVVTVGSIVAGALLASIGLAHLVYFLHTVRR